MVKFTAQGRVEVVPCHHFNSARLPAMVGVGIFVSRFFFRFILFLARVMAKTSSRGKKENKQCFFFFHSKSLTALTHSKPEARKNKKQRQKKKTAFSLTHTNFAQKWSTTNFSREIKKYGTFDTIICSVSYYTQLHYSLR